MMTEYQPDLWADRLAGIISHLNRRGDNISDNELIEAMLKGLEVAGEAMEGQAAALEKVVEQCRKLEDAIRDAHGLISNDLVVPWVIAHDLDRILNLDK